VSKGFYRPFRSLFLLESGFFEILSLSALRHQLGFFLPPSLFHPFFFYGREGNPENPLPLPPIAAGISLLMFFFSGLFGSYPIVRNDSLETVLVVKKLLHFSQTRTFFPRQASKWFRLEDLPQKTPSLRTSDPWLEELGRTISHLHSTSFDTYTELRATGHPRRVGITSAWPAGAVPIYQNLRDL